MTELPKTDKEVVKEAIKEWMDDQLRDFGWWSIKRLAVIGLSLLFLYYIQSKGYHLP